MTWAGRLGYLGAIVLVAIVGFGAPGLIGMEAENFAPLKFFIWTAGLVMITWFGHEMHAASQNSRNKGT